MLRERHSLKLALQGAGGGGGGAFSDTQGATGEDLPAHQGQGMFMLAFPGEELLIKPERSEQLHSGTPKGIYGSR